MKPKVHGDLSLEAQNPKSEARNPKQKPRINSNFKIRKPKANSFRLLFVIRNCFEIRISNFGFVLSARPSHRRGGLPRDLFPHADHAINLYGGLENPPG